MVASKNLNLRINGQTFTIGYGIPLILRSILIRLALHLLAFVGVGDCLMEPGMSLRDRLKRKQIGKLAVYGCKFLDGGWIKAC